MDKHDQEPKSNHAGKLAGGSLLASIAFGVVLKLIVFASKPGPQPYTPPTLPQSVRFRGVDGGIDPYVETRPASEATIQSVMSTAAFVHDVDVADIQPSTTFADLNGNTYTFQQVLGNIQEQYQIEIPRLALMIFLHDFQGEGSTAYFGDVSNETISKVSMNDLADLVEGTLAVAE